MVCRPPTRGDLHTWCLVVCCATLAALSTVAWAGPCVAELPDPAARPAAGNGKFSMITQQCPVLAEPARAQPAAQLSLYGDSASVSISAQPVEAAPAAKPAIEPAAPVATKPDRGAARVMSLAPSLTAAARANQLDPLLLHAIAHIESRHNASLVSPAGARGVMQVMPATAQRFGVSDPERKLFDAETNLRASAAYLRVLRKRFGDDLRLVLAAYNAGEGAVDKYGGNVPPYPETQAYVRDVITVYRRLSAAFTVSESGALIAKGKVS